MSKASTTRDVIAGRYQISTRIASGGMGEVFRAWDSNLRRTVALKVLPLDRRSKPEVVERFRAEAQSAARLSHPNVVQVHDWGETETAHFMVMEYVRGRNLRQILGLRGSVSARQACEIMIGVLDALGAAHDRGLVHRDVKPENILVTIDGQVKVTDFGIARAVEDGTKTAGLYGTVAYVSPEQARGVQIDNRADLYSAGCVLYELLTGSRPFEGDAASVLNQHLNGRVPPPSQEGPDVPMQLDQIVLHATEAKPDRRYASAAEMKADLVRMTPMLGNSAPLSELAMEVTTEVAPEMHDTEVPDEEKRRRLRWWHAALLLLVAGVALAAYAFRPVAVPRLVGRTAGAAQAELDALSLFTKIERVRSDQPINRVVGTRPGTGEKVRWHGTVTLEVSTGPELTDLPNLVGMSLEDATKVIEERRLQLGETSERFDPAAKGLVLEQDPKPGRRKVSDPVNLVVSKGPETVVVPDVRTKPFAEAAAMLQQAGLEPVREDVFNDAPLDQVVDQQPGPSSKINKGSQVRLLVSKGPEPFAMPDVKNKPCTEAKAQLEALGLVVVVNSRGAGCGSNKVLDQDPFPGAQVKKGMEATLYVS